MKNLNIKMIYEVVKKKNLIDFEVHKTSLCFLFTFTFSLLATITERRSIKIAYELRFE